MTVEHRIVFGLGDVRAIVCECTHCGARLTVAPESIDPKMLASCPSCGKWWIQTTMRAAQRFEVPELALLMALREFRDPVPGTSPNGVRMHLEFDEPIAR